MEVILLLLVVAGPSALLAAECKDRENNCVSLKQLGYCFNPRDIAYMRSYCAKTCGYCAIVPKPGPDTGSNSGQCGRALIQHGRIIAGKDAKHGSWPWMLSFGYRGDNSHFCGATLIHEKWALTAAHCVDYEGRKKRAEDVRVTAGEHNRGIPEGTEQILNVRRIIVHPSWVPVQYDIALLELETPAKLNKYVQKVCLPGRGYKPPIGTQCYLSGWGSIQHPGPAHHTLQQARMPVVDKTNCWNGERLVCTGYGRQSLINACRGDSGGPLVCQEPDGTWKQQGVASFVVEYCKYYTAFTQVGAYIDWIRRYVPTV